MEYIKYNNTFFLFLVATAAVVQCQLISLHDVEKRGVGYTVLDDVTRRKLQQQTELEIVASQHWLQNMQVG